MSRPKITPLFSIASSNYNSSDGSVESLQTARVSADIPFIKGGSVSADVGLGTNFKLFENDVSINPAFELKYKQNFTDNIRSYVRYRHIGDTDQVRFAAGYGKSVNNNLTLYADGHYTIKHTSNGSKESYGAWIGADCKINKDFSVWGEIQKNFPTKNPISNSFNDGQWMLNIGCNYKF